MTTRERPTDFTLRTHRLVDFRHYRGLVYVHCSCGFRDPEGQDSAYEARLVWQEHREAVGAVR